MKKIMTKIAVWLGLKKPVISWEEGDMLDNIFEDKPLYEAEVVGYDELGREYSSVGTYAGHPSTHSELIEIDDSETERTYRQIWG